MNENERPSIFSKDVLDTMNSFSWFLMDASWMLEVREVSMAMILPTVISAIFLCMVEKRRTVTFINIAVLSWICMNVSWMFSDIFTQNYYLTMAKSFFGIGILFIILAIATSENISDTFSHFKRFRMKNFKR